MLHKITNEISYHKQNFKFILTGRLAPTFDLHLIMDCHGLGIHNKSLIMQLLNYSYLNAVTYCNHLSFLLSIKDNFSLTSNRHNSLYRWLF
jgi:hypothetical protein